MEGHTGVLDVIDWPEKTHEKASKVTVFKQLSGAANEKLLSKRNYDKILIT